MKAYVATISSHTLLLLLLTIPLYTTNTLPQGTTQQGAQFNIGLLGLKFTYYLKLTHMPKYNTLTWTLDYSKNSDFGESVYI